MCEHVVRDVPGRGSKCPGLPAGLVWACVRLCEASAAGAQEARGLAEDTQILCGLGKGRFCRMLMAFVLSYMGNQKRD